jgi:hypothetical protein
MAEAEAHKVAPAAVDADHGAFLPKIRPAFVFVKVVAGGREGREPWAGLTPQSSARVAVMGQAA